MDKSKGVAGCMLNRPAESLFRRLQAVAAAGINTALSTVMLDCKLASRFQRLLPA